MSILEHLLKVLGSMTVRALDSLEDPEAIASSSAEDFGKWLAKLNGALTTFSSRMWVLENRLAEAKQDVAQLQNMAEQAVKAGRDADADTFLLQKRAMQEKVNTLQDDIVSARKYLDRSYATIQLWELKHPGAREDLEGLHLKEMLRMSRRGPRRRRR